MGIDWGLGAYEEVADQLRPASQAVVERAVQWAGPLAGKRVLDVGCGSGNAALLAAAEGAIVTAVDPSERLLQVARERAERDGLTIEAVPGEAGALPVTDGSAEVVVSVFAVIFAPDPAAAIAELARVTAPDGHILLSTWPPGGPMTSIAEAAGRFFAEKLQPAPAPAAPEPADPAPADPERADPERADPERADPERADPEPAGEFAWHDADALRAAFEPHGFDVQVERRPLVVRHDSPAAYIADSARHPMAVISSQALAAHPDGVRLSEELRAVLVQEATERNEDPAAFQLTNDYLIVSAYRRS